MSELRFANLLILNNYNKSDWRRKISVTLATWFGMGLLPVAPGTYGTLGAVPLLIGLNFLGTAARGVFLLCFILSAIRVCENYQARVKQDDPPEVVLDEVAGFCLTLFLIPFTWLTLLAGFFLFRFFDILKPFPIRLVERRFKGGWGIVADDLLAGLYANLSLRIIIFWLT